MIDAAQWGAPQWLIVILLTASLLVNLFTHGKPRLRLVDDEGVERRNHVGYVQTYVVLLALLSWGGFFA